MNEFVTNLKKQASENPLAAMAAGALLFTATSKLIGANTARQNAKTWQMEVARRAMMSKK